MDLVKKGLRGAAREEQAQESSGVAAWRLGGGGGKNRVLLKREGCAEICAEAAVAVAVDLLPGGPVLEHAHEGNVIALSPAALGVVHIAVGREVVRVARELGALEAYTLQHHGLVSTVCSIIILPRNFCRPTQRESKSVRGERRAHTLHLQH